MKTSSFGAKKPSLGRHFRFFWFTPRSRVSRNFLSLASESAQTYHNFQHLLILVSFVYFDVLQCYMHDRKTHIINIATRCTYILSHNWLLRKSLERFWQRCIAYVTKINFIAYSCLSALYSYLHLLTKLRTNWWDLVDDVARYNRDV